ncbi:hypothetical protein [Streptomyces collinus]
MTAINPLRATSLDSTSYFQQRKAAMGADIMAIHQGLGRIDLRRVSEVL